MALLCAALMLFTWNLLCKWRWGFAAQTLIDQSTAADHHAFPSAVICLYLLASSGSWQGWHTTDDSTAVMRCVFSAQMRYPNAHVDTGVLARIISTRRRGMTPAPALVFLCFCN
jgi:hypothetical protein